MIWTHGSMGRDTSKATLKARGGKVVQGRWVDTNTSDSTAPDYCSRFVGEEFNTGIDPTLYADSPIGSFEANHVAGERES